MFLEAVLEMFLLTEGHSLEADQVLRVFQDKVEEEVQREQEVEMNLHLEEL